jgi:hypothetical protein
MVEFNDPKFLGIAGVMWLFCTVVIWKMTFTGEMFFTTPVKIAMTIIMFPITFGICYMMLRDR